MPISRPVISTEVKAWGKARLIAGDLKTIGGSKLVGIQTAPIVVTYAERYSDLTLESVTGDAKHNRKLISSSLTVTTSVAIVDETIYPIINPAGTRGGGTSGAVSVPFTGVGIIPEDEFGASFGYSGTVWTPATAPKQAIWIPKAHITRGAKTFSDDNGGLLSVEITIQSFFDPTMPEGSKEYVEGDPVGIIPGFKI